MRAHAPAATDMVGEGQLVQETNGACGITKPGGIDDDHSIRIHECRQQPEPERPAVERTQARWCIRGVGKMPDHMHTNTVITEQGIPQSEHQNVACGARYRSKADLVSNRRRVVHADASVGLSAHYEKKGNNEQVRNLPMNLGMIQKLIHNAIAIPRKSIG
jgi:hypothetical protein